MKKKPTIKQIAQLADVSPATVSYVMNGRNLVSKETREKVLRIARQLDYTPNLIAKSLRNQDSQLIFALINSFSSVFSTQFLALVESEFEKHGYQLLTLQSKLPSVLNTNIFDGGIILNYNMPPEQLAKLEVTLQKKVVLLSKPIGNKDVSVVSMDNMSGIQLAVEEMYKSVHRDVCFIQGRAVSANNLERYSAAKQTYQNLYKQSDFDTRIYTGNFSIEETHQLAIQLLKNRTYDAFVCFNDGMALGVYQAAAELGLTVGRDISVIGFDNNFFAKHLTPMLTTIEIDKPLWAKEIVRSYFTVGDPDHQKQVVIPATLIKRDSIAYR